MSEQGDKLGGILLFRADEDKYTNKQIQLKMQNYTNTKRTNSRQLQKEKHTQAAAIEGGEIKPNTQIKRKIQHKERQGPETLILTV